MRALRERVNSGVGPTRAVDPDALIAHTLEGALEIILSRVAMRLALPSRKLASVVRDDQFQASRHPCSPPHLFSSCRFVASIEISLQNYLRRYLIDIAAGRARFLSRFAQRPVCRHCRQPLVPCDDRARQIRAKLFHELQGFGRSGTDPALDRKSVV